jgi:threonyl-tRNA synthetase
MNCPGGMLVYRLKPHSYRELPLRVAELGHVHRHELSGALHGLMRVRSFTQDDAHIFMTEDQIKDEIKGVVSLIGGIYEVFGFQYRVELSTRPEDSMGTEEQWNHAINSLREALEELGINYKINEGDGAFYGPKIDFKIEDSIGRTWQCGTIQLDMQLPERFELEYTGADDQKHRPVMIHRAALGSIERFIGILTEHFAGAFPLWISPQQVKILPIADRHNAFAEEVEALLKAKGVRVSIDKRSEKVGFKIRQAQLEKVPYMLVIGDKEVEEKTVSVRCRKEGDLGSFTVSDFVNRIMDEIDTKKI